jgi:hypothetical protein
MELCHIKMTFEADPIEVEMEMIKPGTEVAIH